MLKRPQVALLLSLPMVVCMWIYVEKVLIGHQKTDAVISQRPRGNLSDLYPRWLGARELLLHGRDPYSEDVTREIQVGYYGRPLDSGRPNDPKDRQAFAYPLYVVILLAPTVGLPFSMVQRAFWCLLVVLTGASVLLWLRALHWRISASSKLLWIVLLLGCFPTIQGLKLQQLTLLVAALLAGGVAAVVHRHFILAGILFAAASIKPQLVLLMGFWLMLWIIGNWRERQRLFWSSAASVAVLLIVSQVLLPGWMREFRAATSAYYQYTGGGRSVLDMALTPSGGRIGAAFVIALLIFFLWQVRREAETSPAFQWSLSAVLVTTLAVIPMFAPYNQVLLIPCLMLVVKNLRGVWHSNRLSRFLVVVTAGSIAWPWAAALALVIGLLFLPANAVERAWMLPLGTSLMIPVCLLALAFVSRRTLLTTTL